jgi:threonine dehydrogenase-like Zn-dependent dehydrogenase
MIGTQVITTAGNDWKLEKARELGADVAINYRETPNLSQRVKELTGSIGRGRSLPPQIFRSAQDDRVLGFLRYHTYPSPALGRGRVRGG